MDFKANLLAAFNYVFPRGNYRWYGWFVPACFVTFLSIYSISVLLLFLLYGWNISTDSFAAHEAMATNYMADSPVIPIIETLLGYAMYILETFCIWVALSLLVDIGYCLYKVMRLVYAFFGLLYIEFGSHGDR